MWCRNPEDNTFFTERLYHPIRYMALSIAEKRGYRGLEIEEIASDMISNCWINFPLKYNENKGSSKSMLYIVLDQFLLNKVSYDNAEKRGKKKTIYIEDTYNSLKDNEIHIIKIEIDLVEFLKNNLDERIDLIDNIGNKLHKKIARHIIEAIEHPEHYTVVRNSLISSIAKKSKSTVYQVHYVIKLMNAIMEDCKQLIMDGIY